MCVLPAGHCGCSQSKPDAETAQPTAAQETGDYLTTISGTYEELFPQLAKAEYRDLWIDATTPLGRRGERRDRDGYAACHVHGRALRPGGFRKVCGGPREHGVQLLFPRRRGPLRHGRPHHFRSGRAGQEVFSHTYHKLDEENENGFLFYQSDDADSGTLPTSPSPRIRWRRPIIWSSAMPRPQ